MAVAPRKDPECRRKRVRADSQHFRSTTIRWQFGRNMPSPCNRKQAVCRTLTGSRSLFTAMRLGQAGLSFVKSDVFS
jgi:hypothetical protein